MAAANPYCGAWMESAGPSQIELEVIDWFRTWRDMPDGTAGVLVSGGSAANLTALLVAREAAGGPDHFGELAARDWGGGYGYARLATVRCADSGRLLRLTSEDFQWLVSSEPTVQTQLAKVLAQRLQQR